MMVFSKGLRGIALASAMAFGSGGTTVAETLKIGVIAPLTGGAAAWGKAAEGAARIVAEDYNAQGGLEVGGRKYRIEIVAYDDQAKAADAVAAFNRLVTNDGVRFMTIFASTGAMAVKQQAEEDGIVVLSSGYGDGVVDRTNNFMFRLYSAPKDYMPALFAWMRDNLSQRRVLLMNVNDEAGAALVKASEALYRENGFEVVGVELTERAQNDFQALFTKIVPMNPEMIDLGGISPATAGLAVRHAREMGYEGLFVKTGGSGPKDIIAGAGAEAAEGLINMLYVDPANENWRKLAARYQEMMGHEPNEILLPEYDGFQVMMKAIQAAGSVEDTAAVVDAFATVLPTASLLGDELTLGGMANYGSDRQIMTTNYVGEIRNGAVVAVGKVK